MAQRVEFRLTNSIPEAMIPSPSIAVLWPRCGSAGHGGDAEQLTVAFAHGLLPPTHKRSARRSGLWNSAKKSYPVVAMPERAFGESRRPGRPRPNQQG